MAPGFVGRFAFHDGRPPLGVRAPLPPGVVRRAGRVEDDPADRPPFRAWVGGMGRMFGGGGARLMAAQRASRSAFSRRTRSAVRLRLRRFFGSHIKISGR